MRWPRLGPRRTLASAALIETKRGSGRFVTGPRSVAGRTDSSARAVTAQTIRAVRTANRIPRNRSMRLSCRGFLDRTPRAITRGRRYRASPRKGRSFCMPASKLKVIVTRKLPEPVETRMRELFDVELNEADQPMRKAE